MSLKLTCTSEKVTETTINTIFDVVSYVRMRLKARKHYTLYHHNKCIVLYIVTPRHSIKNIDGDITFDVEIAPHDQSSVYVQ